MEGILVFLVVGLSAVYLGRKLRSASQKPNGFCGGCGAACNRFCQEVKTCALENVAKE